MIGCKYIRTARAAARPPTHLRGYEQHPSANAEVAPVDADGEADEMVECVQRGRRAVNQAEDGLESMDWAGCGSGGQSVGGALSESSKLFCLLACR